MSATEKITASMELSQLAESRGKIYQFLSYFYTQPLDQNFLKALMNGGLPSFLASPEVHKVLPAEMADGIRVIEDYTRNLKAHGLEEFGRALSVEFTRLFRGVKRVYSPPPPYESVYIDGENLVWGESTAKVLEEYRRSGLDIHAKYKGEPPDHISFELDFMRFLCGKEAEAWKNEEQEGALSYLRLESSFLNEHLGRWVHIFCDRIIELDGTGFYRAVAKLTKGFIELEHNQTAAYIDLVEEGGVDLQA